MSAPVPAQEYSELWGKTGELWSPEGRLPDFSFAGYHFGEDPLPVVEAKTQVRWFGAKGDGRTDDTEAFRRAIAATQDGAILIPPGRFLITDILWIEKPDLVLRGAGPDQTVLLFPRNLEDVRPNMGQTTGGRPTSNYSWSGGFLWVKGSYGSKALSAITSECARGSRTFTVAKSDGLKVGQRVMVEVQDDRDKSLFDHLYSGDPGDTAKVVKPIKTSMVSRIEALDGDRVTLERPLRFDLRAGWSPRLRAFEPTVREVGIEHLTCEFPVKPYQGHFTELGANAIAINGAADCWVRDVRIRNSDSGVYVAGMFCTVTGLTIDSERPAHRGTTGHHGVSFGTDCLLEEFDFQTHFIHDITLGYGNAGNVSKNGKGTDLSLDHHKKANHENLFCNLDVGAGGDLWRCGGGASLGKHCGARGTFWAIRSEQPQTWPPERFGPDSMNLVGVQTEAATQRNPDGRWFEAIDPQALHPADLHAAQLARRMGRDRVPPPGCVARIRDRDIDWQDLAPKEVNLGPLWTADPERVEKPDDAAVARAKYEHLSSLIWEAIHEEFGREHPFRATDEEIQSLKAVLASGPGREADLFERLNSPELIEEFNAKLPSPMIRNWHLERMLYDPLPTANQKAWMEEMLEDQVYRPMVENWKFSKVLYETYGGMVIFQQFNPLEPVGAYRSILEEHRDKGTFIIYDKGMREEFWAYYLRDHSSWAVREADIDYSKPWWERTTDDG